MVQTPNFFGVVEDLATLAELAHARGALLVVANTEPVAFGVLQSPGALGADIVVGEGLGPGHPADARRPGRRPVRGASSEYTRAAARGAWSARPSTSDGRRGYVLTLATREQHIRREKATSNICTNQGLIALAFTIHMSLLGKRGLRRAGAAEPGQGRVRQGASSASCTASRSRFSGPDVQRVRACACAAATPTSPCEKLADQGIYAGVAATAPGMLPKGKAR